MENKSFVHTKYDKCRGCNKCIFVCPTSANEAFFEADSGKVFIKDGFCISCGECLSICDHNARDFEDDTERFFTDLANGDNISVVIAPSARFNFNEYGKIADYLKSIGVNKVYDVSFGADICTWAHIKLLREREIKSLITQPCPVIVSYVEKYKPELIGKLSPIQSPVVCLATYLKKYMGISDKIMFLSPCIGKKRECESEHTFGVIDYNVTFSKFAQHFKENNVDFNNYKNIPFDISEGSIGFTFSRPGGLAENVKYHLKTDVWIKQVEGISAVRNYFDEYLEDLRCNRPVPTIIDALNCIDGCNLGTGTDKTARHNDIDFITNKNKAKVSRENSENLTEFFDSKLNLSDFERQYKDRSVTYKKDKNVDMERAFISLGKITQEDREINCFCCGYGNCYDFVYDLATGHNDKNNCRHYLLNKFKKMSMYDDLTGLNNRNCFNDSVKTLFEEHPGFVGIIFIDINGLKEANDTFGHAFGDELIITCANLCKRIFGSDVYRIGGDEFVILFNKENASMFEIKTEMLKHLFEVEKQLVVSIGCATSVNSDDLQEKLEEADQKMYINKQEYYESINKADRRNRKAPKFF